MNLLHGADRTRLGHAVCLILLLGLAPTSGQSSPPQRSYTTWRDYGGSADSMQYSALTQITKENVNQLELAWFYPVPDRKGNFGFNPIVVDNVMYLLGRGNAIVAVDAVTGKQIWAHSVDGGRPGNRGINYWESRDRSDRRLIFGAGGALRAIDARTGAAITTFGVNGQVNMREGNPRPLGGPSGTPGRVFENLFITGSNTGEGYGSPPGDLRAFDVSPGSWCGRFTRSRIPGEFGYDTWPEEAWKWAGGVNAWGEISIDERRGIAYFPLGSPTHDMFGGDRKGANLFGNSLLALDAAHRQTALALPGRPSRSVGLRSDHRPQAADRPSRRQDGRHRGASDEVRIALRVRPRDRRTALADRRAAGAEERRARRGVVADTAVPDQATAIRAADVRRRRHQPAPRRSGENAAAGHRLERTERGPLHAADARPRSDLDTRRAGRLQLGRERRRSDDRHVVRPLRRSTGHSQAESARCWWRRRLTRAARARSLSAVLRDVSRPGRCRGD